MNKKLKDMTLAEVKRYCETSSCDRCAFCGYSYECSLRDTPGSWVFKNPKRKLRDEDLELLKAIQMLFPTAKGIYAANDISETRLGTVNDREVVFVSCCLFSHDIEDCSITWFEDVEGLE